jgi:hypothetical protein
MLRLALRRLALTLPTILAAATLVSACRRPPSSPSPPC